MRGILNSPLNKGCDFMLTIDNKAKVIYLDRLIKRIYKILPLTEENIYEMVFIYLDALIIDINSANDLFDYCLIDILVRINSLKEVKYENVLIRGTDQHSQVKRTVLGCKEIIDHLKEGLING